MEESSFKELFKCEDRNREGFEEKRRLSDCLGF